MISCIHRLLIQVLAECIMYTWDYHSSISFWNGLRVQPILADEVQTFKALIMVHKVVQEGHQVVCSSRRVLCLGSLINLFQTLKEAQGQTAWLETCARTVGSGGAYISNILRLLVYVVV